MDRSRLRAGHQAISVLFAAALALLTAAGPAMAVSRAHAPATSAAASRWHISKVFGASDGYPQLDGGTAVNARLAWVVGNAETTSESVFLAKWNGTGWRQASVPAQFSSVPSSSSVSDSVVATSPSATWTFPSVYGSKTHTYAARLSKGKWTTYSLPHAYEITAAAAFSSSDVWAFGAAIPAKPVLGYGPPFVARFNGHTWRRSSMPGVPLRVTALSSKNIWAFGPTKATSGGFKQTYIAMHWTGGLWHSITIPRIKATNGKRAFPADLAVLRGGSLWATEEFHCPNPGCVPGQPPGILLVHRAGRKWVRVLDEPAYEDPSVVPDGQGGLWIAALDIAKESFVYLRYDHGKLSTTAALSLPSDATTEVNLPIPIPGTKAAWATADLAPAGANPATPAVFRYRP